jgi:hypothetical protein
VPLDSARIDFEVLQASSISAHHRELLLGLFQTNYREANPAFVDKSLSVLRHVAFGYHAGEAIGFALGESRRMDLPRLPDQLVSLAGLCCVAPAFRRRGLFGELSRLAMAWEAFASVDRDRGDALLAIAWIPDNPPGW